MLHKRFLLIFTLALAAGCTGRTEIVLGVATDLKARGQLDNVTLTASRDGIPVINHSWSLTDVPAGTFELPGSFGIYSPDGSEPRVQIDVKGFLNGNLVVDRQSLLALVSGETLFTRMALVSDCNSIDGPTCSATQSCIEGVCRDTVVNAHTFPIYSPPLVTHVACQSGAQLIVSSSGDPMPQLPGTTGCGVNEFCQEGTCYHLLRGQDAAVESGIWADQSSPVTDVLHAVWQTADGQDLFVVGDAGTILHLTGGPSTGASSWVKEPSGTLANLYGVWGSSANDVWATGTLYGSPVTASPSPAPASGILLHRTGGVWSSVAAPSTATLHAITGTGPSDVWAVGLAASASPGAFTTGGPALLHFDGSAWTQDASLSPPSSGGATGELLSIVAAPNDITAVGRGGLLVHSDGRGFVASTVAPAIGVAPVDLTGILETTANDFTLVGLGGLIGRLQGTTFTAESSGVGHDLFGIAAISPIDLVAVGDYGTIVRGTRSIAAGGTTWSSERSGTNVPLFAVSAGGQAQWVVGRTGTVRAQTSVLPGSCATDTDCSSGSFCAANATCRLQKSGSPATCDTRAGHDCLVDGCRECTSGSCSDGYCCDRGCGGLCEACDVKGAEGTCSPVLSGAPHSGFPDEASPSPSPSPLRSCGRGLCSGVCDGAKSTTVCQFPNAGMNCSGGPGCRPGGGAISSSLKDATCDNQGFCGTHTSCGLLTICNGNLCPANCMNESDCITGYYCDYSTGPSNGVGNCAPDLANGVSCRVGSDGQSVPEACISGLCAVDIKNMTDACCNSACKSTCASSTTRQDYSCTGGTCASAGAPNSCDPYNCSAATGYCTTICFCPTSGTCQDTVNCSAGNCSATTATGTGNFQGSCLGP